MKKDRKGFALFFWIVAFSLLATLGGWEIRNACLLYYDGDYWAMSGHALLGLFLPAFMLVLGCEGSAFWVPLLTLFLAALAAAEMKAFISVTAVALVVRSWPGDLEDAERLMNEKLYYGWQFPDPFFTVLFVVVVICALIAHYRNKQS